MVDEGCPWMQRDDAQGYLGSHIRSTSGLRIGRVLCVGVAIESSGTGLVGFLAMK
jgi:hypothetical protein